MKLLLSIFLLLLSVLASPGQAAETRFDSLYFFQSEDVLKSKQIKPDEMARFSNKVQSQIWKALKKASIHSTSGYLVIAVRSDGKVATWLDMEPALHEFYENAISDAVKKIGPFSVDRGLVVFGIKMNIDTPKMFDFKRANEMPKFTTRAKPSPQEWQSVLKKVNNPDDIEEVVMAAWPEE